MSAQHTPGPWNLTFGDHDAAIYNECNIAAVDNDAIAWQANARLIAAAPELLAALDEVLSQLFADQLPPAVNQRARAAIAKATKE